MGECHNHSMGWEEIFEDVVEAEGEHYLTLEDALVIRELDMLDNFGAEAVPGSSGLQYHIR